jgi:hypothetical protein
LELLKKWAVDEAFVFIDTIILPSDNENKGHVSRWEGIHPPIDLQTTMPPGQSNPS